MSTSYAIFSNGGTGGPVNYATAIATVATLTYPTATLTYPGDYTFGVRSVDTVTGFEDLNVDAITRLILDASGSDITARPNPPSNVKARATAGGGARVEWTHNGGGSAIPTAFQIWLTLGTTVNYLAAPAATITYTLGTFVYKVDLTGLADGSLYTVGVRSANGSIVEPNTTAIATVTGKTTAPADVDSLAITTGYGT